MSHELEVDEDDEREPVADLATTVLFHDQDDKVLAALRILGNGKRSLDDVSVEDLSAMSGSPMAVVARTLDIVRRARMWNDGELCVDVVKYLRARASVKMGKPPAKRRR